jgi:YVTN family beta-propeller protein
MLRKVFGVGIVAGILALVASGATGAATAPAGTAVRQPARSAVPARAAEFPLARIGRAAASAGRYVRVDGSPGVQLAADPRTASVYVPVKCTNPATERTCTATASHVVDVINNAACNARGLSGCAVVAAAVAGDEPVTAVIDERTGTVYVGDAGGSGSITVVDGARCNASVTSGCATPVATIKLASAPDAEALDPFTGTLYVASLAGKVFVINAGRCNTTTTAGCSQPVRAVADRLGPDAIGVNAATDTVYAADAGAKEQGDTVSVIDGATCNATHHSGCGQRSASVTVGADPDGIAVDEPADTIYAASYDGADVAVINGATCNAAVTTGCAGKPAAVPTGDGASGISLDAALHTVYVLNQVNDTMSEISTRTCTGSHPAGCPADARNEQLPFNPPQGANPNAFALLPRTGTAYLANAGGDNFAENTAGGESYVEPVNISGCSALSTSGCRREAPSVTDNFYIQNVDPATHTLYAGDSGLPQIDVINLATCHVRDLSGCAPVATIPAAHPYEQVGAIDDQTHTLYVGDVFSDTVAVINTATCNATDTAGCPARPPTFKTGRTRPPSTCQPAATPPTRSTSSTPPTAMRRTPPGAASTRPRSPSAATPTTSP